ncbi:MAG: U32 family peptidase, partial [Treponema sp.]|nr:U32 family peptidase [Treponema sp.]
ASDSPYILAGTVEEEIAGSAFDEILANGKALVDAHYAELAAMDPRERAARERDLEAHPEKVPQTIEKKDGYKLYRYNALNKTDRGTDLELVSPDVLSKKLAGSDYIFVNSKNGLIVDWVNADHDCAIYTKEDILRGTLVRVKDEEYIEGVVRTTAR